MPGRPGAMAPKRAQPWPRSRWYFAYTGWNGPRWHAVAMGAQKWTPQLAPPLGAVGLVVSGHAESGT